MKTLLCVLALCASLLAGYIVHAQGTYYNSYADQQEGRCELGIAAGGSLYFGDLAADKRNYLTELTPHGGVFVRYYFSESFSLRGNVYAARLSGDDKRYDDPSWRKRRGFSFTTNLYEASMMLEYDLLRHYRLSHDASFGIYGFVGLGACYTNPQRNFNNIDIAYLGAGDKAVWGSNADFYRNPEHVALIMPVGMGLRYDLLYTSTLFLEGGVRQCFDDKLDGFSESVYSGKYDAYAFFSLGLSFRPFKGDR